MKLTLYLENQRSKGFSLLEVLVAMSILSIAVVALFQLFSVNLRSVKKAEDYSKAMLHARSLMDEAYALPKLTSGSESFDFKDGFKGSRDIQPKSAEGNVKTFDITVAVSWLPSGALELKGLRTYYETEE